MKTGAKFSENRKYRYDLWRTWNQMVKKILFIGLNPSTADEINNDPTVTRCINFAKQWNYGGVVVCNIFAFRATLPSVLKKAEEPIGMKNDKWILREAKKADKVVAAWGSHGKFMNCGEDVLEMLKNNKIEVYCFGLNKSGEPRHPLYIKRDERLRLLE